MGKRLILLATVATMMSTMLAVSQAFAAINCNDTRTVCSGGLGGDPVIPEGATGGGQGGHGVSEPAVWSGGGGGGGDGEGSGGGGHWTRTDDGLIARGNNAEADNGATGYCTRDYTTYDYTCKGNKQV